ncbi:hypothetical protein GY45DRAFT_118427 [Cubamyces sp. BRFM 1775]|nr:hypothetical protein GY45DRAFT_118427 [Cubamyces sp. BRFM 1775]
MSSTSPIYGTRRPYASCTLRCAFSSLSPIHPENLRAENWPTPVSPPTLVPGQRHHRLRCVHLARTLLAVPGTYGRLDLTTGCVARRRFILARGQMDSPMLQEERDFYGRGRDRQRGETSALSSRAVLSGSHCLAKRRWPALSTKIWVSYVHVFSPLHETG